jgi:hypothetical protein
VSKTRFQHDGRKWPIEPEARLRRDGPDEGAFGLARKVAPHQFGRMTYDRAVGRGTRGGAPARGRKSWPHNLSPPGRGEPSRFNPSEVFIPGAIPESTFERDEQDKSAALTLHRQSTSRRAKRAQDGKAWTA